MMHALTFQATWEGVALGDNNFTGLLLPAALLNGLAEKIANSLATNAKRSSSSDLWFAAR